MTFFNCYKDVHVQSLLRKGGNSKMEQRVIEDLVDIYSERLLRYATSILYHHQDA